MPRKAYVKEVRDVIAKKLDIGISRIYVLAKELADEAQVSTEDGIYLLAARNNINLNKLLPNDKVNEIRKLHLSHRPVPSAPPQLTSRKTASDSHLRTINIGKQFILTNPILPGRILKEAKEMSEKVYPLLYVLENSIREVILRVMRNKHGENWWEKKGPKEIIKEVQKRKETENENPWHGRRGSHEIYYTDILHLGRIVQNNWADFKNILPDAQWLTLKLGEISHSRNPVSHMNPLKENDINRIKVFFTDWQNIIKAKLSIISE